MGGVLPALVEQPRENRVDGFLQLLYNWSFLAVGESAARL